MIIIISMIILVNVFLIHFFVLEKTAECSSNSMFLYIVIYVVLALLYFVWQYIKRRWQGE